VPSGPSMDSTPSPHFANLIFKLALETIFLGYVLCPGVRNEVALICSVHLYGLFSFKAGPKVTRNPYAIEANRKCPIVY
jgi:hypothetical protein